MERFFSFSCRKSNNDEASQLPHTQAAVRLDHSSARAYMATPQAAAAVVTQAGTKGALAAFTCTSGAPRRTWQVNSRIPDSCSTTSSSSGLLNTLSTTAGSRFWEFCLSYVALSCIMVKPDTGNCP